MIERRREQRISAEFAVEIRGRNAAGNPFLQSVCVRDVSRSGALLAGIEHELRCGDVIEIRLANRVARFRVIWTLGSGCPQRELHVSRAYGRIVGITV